MSSHKNGGNPISGPLNFLRSSAREILGKNPSNGPSPVGSPVLGKSEVVSAKSETEALCSGWMKMRHPMKKWVSRWFVLRQGILVYYRDEKTAINPKRKPSGAILLADTEVREDRISKDGMFSLKIEHLHNRSVFKTRPGFKLTPSLRWNWNYCVLRIASESSRKTWITAIIPQIEYATSHRNAIHFNISQDDESDFEDESDHEGNILPNSPKLARQAQPSSLGTHVITANTLSPPVQINLRHSSDVASHRSRSASANEMQPSITLKSQSVEDIVTDPNLRGELSTTEQDGHEPSRTTTKRNSTSPRQHDDHDRKMEERIERQDDDDRGKDHQICTRKREREERHITGLFTTLFFDTLLHVTGETHTAYNRVRRLHNT